MSAGATGATFAATLVDEWIRAGVRHAVVCPGSRSTPLAVAVAQAAAAGRIVVHVRLDERAGGFTALGIGMATGRPAVVVTTSGTAAVELHPAVVEAHHAGVPLLVCTADRPPELHHVGAPQTIDQSQLFGTSLRWKVDPGVPDEGEAGTWRSLAARMVAEAVGSPRGPGPVHANVPFAEPLGGAADPLPPGRADGRPWHQMERGVAIPDEGLVAYVASLRAQRGVIVAGAGCGSPTAVAALGAALRWPIIADPRSGLRRNDLGATVVGAADALLRVEEISGVLTPTVVLCLGAPAASKVLAQWIASIGKLGSAGRSGRHGGRGGTGPEVVLVDPHSCWRDPGRAAARVVACDPNALAEAVTGRLQGSTPTGSAPAERSPWEKAWADAEAAAQGAVDDVLARHTECTEPAVARQLWRLLQDGDPLFVSSSMPVRDLEWFAEARAGSPVVFANRGANGIDGTVSTTMGIAGAYAQTATDTSVSHRPTALLGDLATLYDIGGLVELTTPLPPATFVVLDNGGGGIFSFLPQAKELDDQEFERILATPPATGVAEAIRGFGVPVAEIARIGELEAALEQAGRGAGPSVVVVRTHRAANVAVHDELWQAVASACRSAL